jgi:ATP-dependent Clp protease ATP-binding subunit ClpB
VRSFFRPEFLNRLDDLVVFRPLDEGMLLGIARMMAAELNERLHPRNISLAMTDAALRYVVAHCTDLAYGARPLRRWLEQHIITDLSRMLIGGQLAESCDVTCDVAAGGESLTYAVEAKGAEEGGAAGPGGVLGREGFKRRLYTAPSGASDLSFADQDDEMMVA